MTTDLSPPETLRWLKSLAKVLTVLKGPGLQHWSESCLCRLNYCLCELPSDSASFSLFYSFLLA